MAPAHHTEVIQEVIPIKDISPLLQDVPKWQRVTEDVFSAVVSIRFSQAAAFDTEPALSSEATGFIVDAARGIILTNRHVVGAGPFVGEAIMYDHEEVEVKAIYRDPIHDFGFLRFDPSQVKYMKLREIKLMPESARVGIDVRVIGNDAGEKLSILAGSISRVDRNAPEYGDLTYNDFNTFYLQAASSLSGGSSGSPVIDVNGHAVALQAGGRTEEATNFFLPLDRVKRALECIQAGESVVRGTMQTRFTYTPFDECRRLGLTVSTEAMVRREFPDGIGMLVVNTALPEGPGRVAGLEEGDVLVSINDEIVTHFVKLENYMDCNVGQKLALVVDRGGKAVRISVGVQDLHSITPSRYVTLGGAILNNLSFQLACAYNVPVRGVYLASPGNVLALSDSDEGTIIASVDSKPVNSIDEFVEVIKAIPEREFVPVSFYSIEDVHSKHGAVIQIMRHWSSLRIYTRNDSTGLWDFTTIRECPKPREISPVNVKFPVLDNVNAGKAAELANSMVKVLYQMPIRIDGSLAMRCKSYGVVVDAERGLVAVSRRTIPVNIGDLSITIAESAIIPAKLRFAHPSHNFAIIQYDPKHIGDTDIKAAKLSLKPLKQGDPTRLISYSRYGHPVCINTVVSDTMPVVIPPSAFPRWRCINSEVVTLESPLTLDHSSGVLADDEGHVQALWLSHLSNNSEGKDREIFAGLPVKAILPVLELLQRGEDPKLRSLNIEVTPITIALARKSGLGDEWVRRIQEEGRSRGNLFWVKSVETLSKAVGVLRELDIIISINGKLMTRLEDLDVQYTLEKMEVLVLRDKQEVRLQVETTECSAGTDRLVFWAGATFQAPHKAALQQSRTVPSGVYTCARSMGSPAYMYDLAPTMWITQVNGVSTPDLDSFERAVRACPDNTYVRIKAMTFDSVPMVLSVKTCYHYWPTSSLVRDPTADEGWRGDDDGE
ncbi:trypsin-like serine protease [Martensiomyces pterosporus]|nr:trypsin-like serine protease [Martensiomyces pterosporus]